MLTTKQAAELLGVSDSHVRRLILDGKLSSIRLTSRMQVLDNTEVETYAREHPRSKAGRPPMKQSQKEYAATTEGLTMQSRQLDLSSFSDTDISEAAAGHWPARGEAFRLAALAEARGRGLLPMPTEYEAWE